MLDCLFLAGFEEDILIVSEGKMAPFTHDFRKAQQRMPAIPVHIQHVNFTWQVTDEQVNNPAQIHILDILHFLFLFYLNNLSVFSHLFRKTNTQTDKKKTIINYS